MARPSGRYFLPAETKFAFLLPGGRNAYALKTEFRRSFIDLATARETPLGLEIRKQGYYGGPNFIGYPDPAGGFQLYEIVDAGARLLADLPLGRPAADWFAYLPDARLLAWKDAGSAIIHVTPIDRLHEQYELTSDGEFCLPACFDLTGRYLLAVGPGGDARIWDLASRQRLPAVKSIVESHDGHLECDSMIGHGTTFLVLFPAVPAETVSEGVVELRPSRGELILVVDDEEPLRELTQMILERHGYRVITAENGADGLTVFAAPRDEIAVVVSDHRMPVMDGSTMFRAIHQIKPGMRAVTASGLQLASNDLQVEGGYPHVASFSTLSTRVPRFGTTAASYEAGALAPPGSESTFDDQ